MSRIRKLQKYVHHAVKKCGKKADAVSHLHGVSFAAAVLAEKRGEDAELAAMAGLLHDVYAYKSGSYDDHAHLGSEYARKVLKKLKITTKEETEIICHAIYHHSDKDAVHGPFDEILKDADVLHHTLDDPTKAVKAHEKERYEKLRSELGFIQGAAGKGFFK